MSKRRLYLHTNIFIAGVEQAGPRAIRLFDPIAAGSVKVVTSEITLSETLVKPLELLREEVALIYTRFFADDTGVESIPVSRSILLRSAEIRARAGGKLPDAIHVATAPDSGCEIVVSNDRKMPLLDPLRRMALEELDVEPFV
ncbi:type II toxin-antitoxin system VapC family toxin [Fulvimarina sp. MAC8]|uniref:type II toxin-antitoxin system VapC family toxin n=1 Tax=Fulvimarina sp. MAC8 TaxID=3162874 RepID=UPI0032EF962A